MAQDAEHEGKASGPVADAEHFVAERDAPIHERRFFEIADSVRVQRHPIVPDQHLPRGFGMDRVGVIEQWRGENACEVNRQPET